ncbi:fumarylacetoacetate hydrolase family protein [Sphingobium aquiterrae]|uniref:fumarylacetoacetate hydrolase family protein n=1 Tax=Sphingobium aquiterrae TaxID=2038656 RepID=UPI003015B08E
MKLINFLHEGRQSFGIVENDIVIDLGGEIEGVNSVDQTLAEPQWLSMARDQSTLSIPLAAITFLPPVLNPRLMAMVGLNYASHIAETGREPPKYPSIFTRCTDSVVGHLAPLIRPRVSEKFDYEGELAIVIGKGGRHIAKEDAYEHVAGYTLFNDGSVRDYQRHTIQFFPGKNFWRSGSVGPWIVTRDEAPAPAEMTLTTRLNGAVMQQARLDDLVFGVPELISYLSDVLPLVPGDIIATGTPGGVGAFREPPVWMKPGDRVEVEVCGIGTLVNMIVDEE